MTLRYWSLLGLGLSIACDNSDKVISMKIILQRLMSVRTTALNIIFTCFGIRRSVLVRRMD